MRNKSRKNYIELVIYSISFLIVLTYFLHSAGCSTPVEENKAQDTLKKDTVMTYKELTGKEFDKATTELSKLMGKNDKLNKEYIKLSEQLVEKRDKIFKLISAAASDTIIVKEYKNFMELGSQCKIKTDSLLKSLHKSGKK